MASNVLTSPWVHVKGSNSRTLQIIHEAKLQMPRDLVGFLGVAYILATPTRSGNKPTVVWNGGDPHKTFSRDMSARVVFTVRSQSTLF